MKIIQSFFLLTVGFCATTIVYAQELKPEIAKPIEVKILPAAIDTKPSPVSELKPQPGPDPKETASSAVAETPSPLKKDENIKPNENAKTVALTIEGNEATKNLTAEQLKTLNGVSEMPKVKTAMPNTIDNSVRPVPAKPAVGKVQQQQ
ncbi:MAG: hypothetical protein IPL50_00160 [Chitinophagaceae bacterium]|nr:hypothetical protein [Chitinophagaceae bacterium]